MPPENLFGHTKKLGLILSALDEGASENRRRPLRVLDYGCGNGAAVTRFLCRAGYRVLGVDLHEQSIAYARREFGSPTCTFVVGDWREVAAVQERFDAIVFADVLEHVDDPAELLHGAREALLPGGRVLVSIPNGFGPFEAESYISRLPVVGPLTMRLVRGPALMAKAALWCIGRRRGGAGLVPYNEESGHLQFFSRGRILELCRETGFRVSRFENLSFLCGPYSNSLLARWHAFCRWNARVADRLPAALVSAWFLELRAMDH